MGCAQSVEAAVGAVYDVSGSVVDVSSIVVDVSASVVDVSASVVDVSASVVDVSSVDVSVAAALEDLKEPTPVTQGSVSPDPEPSTPAPLQTDALL
jgi:methyl-accepting chemotaxis protein